MAVAHDAPAASTEVPVTLRSLLEEMASTDAVARFPQPGYQCLQASSYNRASTHRNQPKQDTSGWFADGDGTGFIRTETMNGKTEWVIMEHTGPGCLTKMWTPFFYSDFNICSRTRSLDAIPFTQRLVFDMESSFGTDIRNPWNLLGYSAATFWYAKPGATHNRPALPELAARPIMSLAEVAAKSEAIRAPANPAKAANPAKPALVHAIDVLTGCNGKIVVTP